MFCSKYCVKIANEHSVNTRDFPENQVLKLTLKFEIPCSCKFLLSALSTTKNIVCLNRKSQ